MARSRFDIEGFIESCRAAVAAGEDEPAIRELVREAVSDLPAVCSALPGPEHAGLRPLYRAPDLTILDFAWAPWMCFKPHDHHMWAVIGLLDGREDNIFWRRTADSIEAFAARSLGAGDVVVLDREIIHSVTNPLGKMTRAIHVYGGDFFAPPRPRSEWEHERLVERPWSLEETRRRFREAEARYRATQPDAPAFPHVPGEGDAHP